MLIRWRPDQSVCEENLLINVAVALEILGVVLLGGDLRGRRLRDPVQDTMAAARASASHLLTSILYSLMDLLPRPVDQHPNLPTPTSNFLPKFQGSAAQGRHAFPCHPHKHLRRNRDRRGHSDLY